MLPFVGAVVVLLLTAAPLRRRLHGARSRQGASWSFAASRRRNRGTLRRRRTSGSGSTRADLAGSSFVVEIDTRSRRIAGRRQDVALASADFLRATLADRAHSRRPVFFRHQLRGRVGPGGHLHDPRCHAGCALPSPSLQRPTVGTRRSRGGARIRGLISVSAGRENKPIRAAGSATTSSPASSSASSVSPRSRVVLRRNRTAVSPTPLYARPSRTSRAWAGNAQAAHAASISEQPLRNAGVEMSLP